MYDRDYYRRQNANSPNRWTPEQLTVALEFFHFSPEAAHTDSHPECQAIASLIGKTPGAVDRTLRNIKYVVSGGTGLSNASSRVYAVVAKYKDNLPLLKTDAAIYINQFSSKAAA